jgi:hypothetical protein
LAQSAVVFSGKNIFLNLLYRMEIEKKFFQGNYREEKTLFLGLMEGIFFI